MWNWIKRMFGNTSGVTRPRVSLNFASASTANSTVEPPQKTYDERIRLTPNRQPNRIKPEAVVLHHSDGSYLGGVEWIGDPVSRVSYHVLIARDGRRTVFGNDTDRCWHAGASSWQASIQRDCGAA